MENAITIEGRCFRAQSHPEYRHVWSVYDKEGVYIESFGGSNNAARERVYALDLHKIALLKKPGE